MRSRGGRWVAAILWTIVMAACGGSTTPSAPTPQQRNLAGLWAGAVGLSAEDGRSLGLLWNAERMGDGQLAGTATLSTLPSAPAQITFVGTMTSVRKGDVFMLAYAPDPGSPAGSGCVASATGTAHLEDFTLVGDLAVTYQSCDALGLQPPASSHLQLLMKLN